MQLRKFAIASVVCLSAAGGVVLPGQASAGETPQAPPVGAAFETHASSEFTGLNLSGAQWDATISNRTCNGSTVHKINANVPGYVDNNIESHRTWSYCQSMHFDQIWHAGANTSWYGGIQNDIGGFRNLTSSIAYR